MKKHTLFCICFLLMTKLATAQAPNWLWGEEGAGSGYGYCSGLTIDNSDNLFIYGRTGGLLDIGGLTINPAGTYPFMGKLDSAGSTNTNGLWLESGVNNGFDYTYGMCIDNKDNSYGTGNTNAGAGVFVEKFNNSGGLVWQALTPNSNCGGFGLVTDNSGNVYATGDYSGTSIDFGSTTGLPYGGGAWAGFLTKYDSTGNPVWAAYFSATDSSNDNYVAGKSVAEDLNGNLYVVGTYQGAAIFYSANGSSSVSAPVMPDGPSTNGNLFVAKYDSSGTAQWVVTVPNAGMEYNSFGYLNKIKVDSCGNIYVAGYFQNTATFGTISVTCNNGSYDMFVAKYNTGAQQWEWAQTGLGSGSTYANDIALDKNGNAYVAGGFVAPATFGDSVLSSGTGFIAKYSNSNGALQWIQSANIQGQADDIVGIAVDKQNYVYVDGTYSGNTSTLGSITLPDAPGGSIFVAKLDTVPSRTIVPVVSANYCPGETDTLPYSITGTFNSGNVFIAELSDSLGSFADPIVIGETTSTESGTIIITIPVNVSPGGTYLVRVVSSNPPTSSYANGCGAYYQQNVYPNNFYIAIGINCINGINQIEINNSIQLFPNPFTSELFIKINPSAGNLENWNLQLTDVLGRVIYKTQSLNYLNDIDMAKIPSGMYFISIANQTGRAVFSVVKQE